MERLRIMIWIAALLFCVAGPIALAGELSSDEDEKAQESQWDYSDLGKCEFGSILYGPDFVKEDLKDKVVLVVVFSYRSGDVNALKDIAKFAAKYRRSGFAAIGVKMWEKGSGKSIVSIAKGMKIKSIPIVDYARLGVEGKKREGVKNVSGRVYCPYAVLYGRAGKIVWERRYVGARKEVNRLIKRELKKRSGAGKKKTNDFEAILDDEFPGSPAIVKLIKAGRLGIAYRKCEKLADTDDDASEEAKDIKGLLDNYHERQLELFQEQKTAAPTEAVKTLGGISKTFRGTAFSKKARATLAELKKDKEFQTLLKSYRLCERIMTAIKKIPVPPADEDDRKKWDRKYKARITRIYRQVEVFEKKYPDSPFTEKLEEALIPFDMEI